MIPVIINNSHTEHESYAKNYKENPERIFNIKNFLIKNNLYKEISPQTFSEDKISEIHNKKLIKFLKQTSTILDDYYYPDVFPKKKKIKNYCNLKYQAGIFCFDSYSPLNKNIYSIAKDAVDCALSGADLLLSEEKLVYALIRPPGHHAEKSSFGGFCYFNSTAAAANYLSKYGKVAVLDIDYHHGNGTQDIFYNRNDVLTISIHADPADEYPYFSGHAKETGKGEGKNYNINYPLKINISNEQYIKTLCQAVQNIKHYKPDFLVTALGFDTQKNDPAGTWNLEMKEFYIIGKIIKEINLPVLIVQEGGYNIETLGNNACSFFTGLTEK